MSDDLISRQAAIDAFYKCPNIDWTTLDVLAKIKELPSAERRGKWHDAYFKGQGVPCGYVCSECGYKAKTRHKFCPDCGARMEVEE